MTNTSKCYLAGAVVTACIIGYLVAPKELPQHLIVSARTLAAFVAGGCIVIMAQAAIAERASIRTQWGPGCSAPPKK